MRDRPFRVALDARSLNTGHLRGIGKSVFEFVKRTAASGAVDWHLLADRPDQPMQVPNPDSCAVSVFETRGDRLHAWEQWSLPRRAQQLGVEVMHAPGTSMPWWQPVPTVVTIHDTIPWQQQDPAWPPGFYRDRLLPAAYHRAAAITTVSDATSCPGGRICNRSCTSSLPASMNAISRRPWTGGQSNSTGASWPSRTCCTWVAAIRASA